MLIKKFIINSIFLIKNLYGLIFLTKEKKISKILLEKHIKLSIAESCTGGLVSSRLTDVSGSSAYIFQNLVTYANEAKESLLRVNPETIKKYGAVSPETAKEMAEGLLNNYNCNLAAAITGIAGSTGGSREKPAGLIYMAAANKNKCEILMFQAPSLLDRRIMKYEFSNKLLDFLYEFMLRNY